MCTALQKFPTFLGLLLRSVDLSCCSRPRSHCLLTHFFLCFILLVIFGCNDRFLLIGLTTAFSWSPLLLLFQPSGATLNLTLSSLLSFFLQPIVLGSGSYHLSFSEPSYSRKLSYNGSLALLCTYMLLYRLHAHLECSRTHARVHSSLIRSLHKVL